MSADKDNEVCVAWLADALRRVRLEGQTKVAGYLEAVSEEVAFEVNAFEEKAFSRP